MVVKYSQKHKSFFEKQFLCILISYFVFLFFRTDRFTMGQNLAIIWSTVPLEEADGDFPSRIQNWFNEVRKYAWGASWSPATGHYSQVSLSPNPFFCVRQNFRHLTNSNFSHFSHF